MAPQTSSGGYLESYFKNPSDYEQSFSKSDDVTKMKVLALTTSHHFLAKDLIARSFAVINPIEITTVIIVGPDHFQQIKDPKYYAQTSDTTWYTPFGDMETDSSSINQIAKFNGVLSDTNLFRTEHSIYTLVPFAKNALPNTKILPLVLRQSSNFNFYYDLGDKISKLIDIDKSVLVISSDFSHGVNIQKAKEYDNVSIRLLPGKNIKDIEEITNDCIQCMALLFGYLKGVDTEFSLLFNKNSYDISAKDPNNVTSYIGANYTKATDK